MSGLGAPASRCRQGFVARRGGGGGGGGGCCSEFCCVWSRIKLYYSQRLSTIMEINQGLTGCGEIEQDWWSCTSYSHICFSSASLLSGDINGSPSLHISHCFPEIFLCKYIWLGVWSEKSILGVTLFNWVWQYNNVILFTYHYHWTSRSYISVIILSYFPEVVTLSIPLH